MSKKAINQNTNSNLELLNSIEPNFIFDEKPINRFKNTTDNFDKDKNNPKLSKIKELANLKDEITSIEDCNLKNNSKNIV